jgi:signal transduction histidine kinase
VILNLVINAVEAMSGMSEGPRELSVSLEKVTAIPGYAERERFEARPGIEREGLSSDESAVTLPKVEALSTEEARSSSAGSELAQILVSVADAGPGLDPKDLGRLFETFYTTKPQGLGMGLAISRSIVEAHGGRLWATANTPKGALFQFTLPIGNE